MEETPTVLQIASKYETQSEGELLALCESTDATKRTETEVEVKSKDAPNSPPAQKIGRTKRKLKRLKKEPPNITSEDGPRGVHVLDFAEARATEIKSMLTALSSKESGKLTSQRLPRHMRRRAASHNVKRLPRRCREAAAREMEKSKGEGALEKSKRSRKHRRNACNLQSKYAQRQRTHKWLESHVWHTKRMKMCSKWGFQLSKICADKGVRAAYRSLTHGCLISDISYYGCTQVTGIQSHVIKCLAPLFNSDTGLTIASKAFLTGAREGKAILYKRGQYPFSALGPVQFFWQALPPSQSTTPSDQTIEANKPLSLWVWSHPAIHEEVFSQIKASVEAYSQDQKKTGSTDVENEISVINMQHNLLRFRLIGPRSHALLMQALKPVFECTANSDSSSDPVEVDSSSLPEPYEWWKGARQNDIDAHCHLLSTVHTSIKSAPSPANFQRGTILGMTVLDPRLATPSHKVDMVSAYYPPKKSSHLLTSGYKERNNAAQPLDDMETEPTEKNHQLLISLPMGVAYSSLWNSYIAAIVSNMKELQPTHLVNELRSKQPLRSSTLELGRKAIKIPVLLIQQTFGLSSHRLSSHTSKNGSQTIGYGWDIILPSNWGNEFWVSLVYHGARACGLEELQKCSLELGTLHFPNDFPDTQGGRNQYEEERKLLVAEYQRSPPDKRRNYGKFLIASPFDYPWSSLISIWSQESRLRRLCWYSFPSKRIKLEGDTVCELTDDLLSQIAEKERPRKRVLVKTESQTDLEKFSSTFGYYVLRSTEVISSLLQFINVLFSKKYQKSAQVDLDHLKHSFKAALQELSIDHHLKTHCSALVAVRVTMYQRGTLSSHSVISVPTVTDFAPLVSSSRYHPHSGPKEDINPKGLTVMEGDSLTIGVSSLTKKKISEVKARRKLVEKSLKKLKDKVSGDILLVQASATVDFHLHSVQPKRETFGYITSAGYRQTLSLCSGVGFCTFAGLLETLCRSYLAPGVCEPLALVRGEDTQYWFVRITIL